MTLNIVSPGPLTTVQDFGRFSHQAEGYPECGACDKYALALANLLCGNGECPHMAGLEYTLAGPTLRADDYTLVALTGGAVEPKVNGKRVNMFEPLLLVPGDTLEIGMLVSGLRGYLAVFGGFDIHPVLGSRSTDLKCHIGGLNGRALKAGDVLPVLRAFELPQERFRPLQKRVRAAALEDWALTTLTPHGFIGAQKFPLLRVVLGPQDEMFTEKGLFDFKSALYTVTQDSNRMEMCIRDSIEGVHYFSGTQRKKLDSQRKELAMLAELTQKLKTAYSFETVRVEYGPGLYFPYFNHEDHSDTLAPLRELAPDLGALAERLSLIHI